MQQEPETNFNFAQKVETLGNISEENKVQITKRSEINSNAQLTEVEVPTNFNRIS
jgi:hypothetical protein